MMPDGAERRRGGLATLLRHAGRLDLSGVVLGIGLGVLLACLGYAVISLRLLGNLLVGLAIVTIALVVGALVARAWFRSTQSKLEDRITRAGELLERGAQLGLAALDYRAHTDTGARLRLEGAIDSVRGTALELIQFVLSFLAMARAIAWFVTVLTAAGSFAIFMVTYMQVDRLDAQIRLLETQNRLVAEQNVLLEAERRSTLNAELTSVLEGIDRHLGENASGSAGSRDGAPPRVPAPLPDHLVGRTVALSRALRPYRYLADDGTFSATTSPERGHLLLALVSSGVDMSTILRAGADFSSADFAGLSLQRVVLRGATLEDIDFRNVRFDDAEFVGARLIRAKLSGAVLVRADLTEADLSFADLTAADIRRGTLVRTNLFGAALDRVNLPAADLQGADLRDAHLRRAGLALADLRGASLMGADLTGAVLMNAKLPAAAAFRGALLGDVDLEGAHISSVAWLAELGSAEVGAVGFDAAAWRAIPAPADSTGQAALIVSAGAGGGG